VIAAATGGQYHNNVAAVDSEPVSQIAPAPAEAPPAAPVDPPAPVRAAPDPPAADPQPEPERVRTPPAADAPAPASSPAAPNPPDVVAPVADAIRLSAAADAVAPEPAGTSTDTPATPTLGADAGEAVADVVAGTAAPIVPAAVVPVVAPVVTGGNTNVSIRILSPGDDGPVTQIGGVPGGGSAAPTTWVWNWTWSGAPTCPATVPAVGAGDWEWNWTWTCDAVAAGSGPALSGVVPQLSEALARALDLLPTPASIAPTGSDPLATHAPTPRPTGATEAAKRAGHAAAHVQRAPGGGAVSPARWAPPQLTAQPVVLAPAAIATPLERAAARHRRADTTRERRAISPIAGPGAVSVAAAAGVAAAGSAPGPAVLASLICLLACFLARALLPAVGLPRPLLRGARLERPG